MAQDEQDKAGRVGDPLEALRALQPPHGDLDFDPNATLGSSEDRHKQEIIYEISDAIAEAMDHAEIVLRFRDHELAEEDWDKATHEVHMQVAAALRDLADQYEEAEL